MLTLHAGACEVSYEALRTFPMPPATESHLPIAHHEIVELMRYTLGFHQHEIAEEHHAVTPDGMRYFGAMMLRSDYGDYTDMIGLRNSHDKTFPIGIAYGSRVFVCDNLSFIGEHVMRRKHTSRAKRELTALVTDVVGPLQEKRIAQNQQFLAYQRTPVDDVHADHAILQMYLKSVIGSRAIDDVLAQWNKPSHDWGNKTAWRLFNAATSALAGKVVERPALTQQLHKIVDDLVSNAVH